ncbi:MAG: ABC transporter ATP-binding protein [Candidatus Omnitrophica bacterium]|nr:ABC transporter ATP-binding protein [Candidatus Omnitrophota bacterium]
MSDSKEVLLSVQSASKIYKMGEIDVPALRDASIDILDGEFLIVVGPSGSGKSTLLNLIGGMDRPTEGNLTFLDEDLSHFSDRKLTLYRKEQIGFIFQFYNLIPTLTAFENVQVAIEIAQDPMDPMEALRMVGLEDRSDHFPSQLSGGQQQRVSIARAIASNPRLLLCDEPTGALDIETSKQVLGLLKRLNRELKKTVVLITHNGAIAGIGDRIAQLRDGRIATVKENSHPTPVEDVQW